MHIRLIGSVLSALVLVAMAAGSSVAGETADLATKTAPADVVEVKEAQYRAVPMSSGDASPSAGVHAPTCWTAFAPPMPDGIAMYQYYRNCNGYGLYVFPGYTYGGTIYQTGECVYRTNGSYIFWYYAATVQGAGYNTFAC